MHEAVNAVLFEHLFMELVFHTLDTSHPDDSNEPDHEIAFYKIERIGFTIGQRVVERFPTPLARLVAPYGVIS